MTDDTPRIRYRIQPERPESHLFAVTLTIDDPSTDGQLLSMAAWIPGSYMIRDFARNVVSIAAFTGQRPVLLSKIDKQTWRCEPVSGPLTVRYEVYAWDLSVRGAHLDVTHGYFNGTSVFLRAEGREHEPCELEIRPPEGEAYRDWWLATTLPGRQANHQFGRFIAADWEELIDHPVEMGRFTLVEFEACGVPHELVVTGRHRADLARVARDLKVICEHHIRFFGEPAPMERYQFQLLVVGNGYGGLEHRASTSLICSREDLPAEGDSGVSDGYRGFLGLCSHEYFHTWNVKRIKPAVFQPYELGREVHTSLLWAFEGITSYYDDLALVRTGLITRQSYLELLGRAITRVLRGRGRFRQSVAESSFDAWTRFYKQDENAPNAIVSYYIKGSLIALALDITLRRETDGARSLDDLMRALWEQYGRTGRGVSEDGIEHPASALAGKDLSGFFDHVLRGTEDIPLQELFGYFGIGYHLRPAEGPKDRGGHPGSDGTTAGVPDLGLRATAESGGARVANVFDGGAARAAGIAPGDLLIALDGLRVTTDDLTAHLRRYRVDDTVPVHLFRGDELHRFEVTLQLRPEDTCWLTLPDPGDTELSERVAGWLAG